MLKCTRPKILVVFVLAFFVLSCQPPQRQEEVEEASLAAAPVKVFKVKRQRISEKLFYTGLIEAWNTINITPDVGGKIAKIYVEEGDRVQKGQLLAELDTRAISLQLEQAKAGFAVAEANKVSIRASFTLGCIDWIKTTFFPLTLSLNLK